MAGPFTGPQLPQFEQVNFGYEIISNMDTVTLTSRRLETIQTEKQYDSIVATLKRYINRGRPAIFPFEDLRWAHWNTQIIPKILFKVPSERWFILARNVNRDQ